MDKTNQNNHRKPGPAPMRDGNQAHQPFPPPVQKRPPVAPGPQGKPGPGRPHTTVDVPAPQASGQPGLDSQARGPQGPNPMRPPVNPNQPGPRGPRPQAGPPRPAGQPGPERPVQGPRVPRPVGPTNIDLVEKEKAFNPWILVSLILIVALGVGTFFAYRLISGQQKEYTRLETEASNLRMAQDKMTEDYQTMESERQSLASEVASLEEKIEELEEKQKNPGSLMVDKLEVKVPEDWLLVPGDHRGTYFMFGSKLPGDVSQGYIYTRTIKMDELGVLAPLDLTDPLVVDQAFNQLLYALTQNGDFEFFDYYETEVNGLQARVLSGNNLEEGNSLVVKILVAITENDFILISATDENAQNSQILMDSIVPHEKGELIILQ